MLVLTRRVSTIVVRLEVDSLRVVNKVLLSFNEPLVYSFPRIRRKFIVPHYEMVQVVS